LTPDDGEKKTVYPTPFMRKQKDDGDSKFQTENLQIPSSRPSDSDPGIVLASSHPPKCRHQAASHRQHHALIADKSMCGRLYIKGFRTIIGGTYGASQPPAQHHALDCMFMRRREKRREKKNTGYKRTRAETTMYSIHLKLQDV